MNSQPTDYQSEDAIEPASQRDQRLAELANQLADQLREGTQPDVESLARQLADLADELRGLWATMLVADCVAAGMSASGDVPLSGPSKQDANHDRITTPFGQHTEKAARTLSA